MKKYNLFDNFICLLFGAVIGIFLYINFFNINIKYQEIEKPVEIIKYIDLTDVQKLNLIKTIKDKLINYNSSHYLMKKDIISFFVSFEG